MLEELKPIFDPPAQNIAQGEYTPNLTFAQYGATKGLNASVLKEDTALEMRRAILGEDDRFTEDFALGEAAHKAVLEPDLFDTDGWQAWFAYSPTKGLDTKAAQSAREALEPNMTLVTEDILDRARRIRDAVHDHPDARELLKNSDRELSGVVWDPLNNLWRKNRVDIRGGIGSKYITDLKTVRSEKLHKFKSTVAEFGYHMQAAYYLDCDKLITGEERDEFYFIIATKVEPFLVRVIDMSPDHIQDARAEYLERMAKFIISAEKNYWPAYQHEGIQRLPYAPFRGK